MTTGLPRRRSRRRLLAALAGAVVVIAGLVETLIVTSWATIQRETERFEREVYVITNLANVQRETVALARDITLFLDGAGEREDVDVRRALLEQQLRVATARLGAQALVAYRAQLDAVDRALADGDPGSGLTRSLDVLEDEIKALYDDNEMHFLRSFTSANDARMSSRGWLLGLSALMLVLGGSAFEVFRRSLARDVAHARVALDASEARYRSVVHSVKDVIFQLDASGHVTFLNPSWRCLTGSDPDDCVGRRLEDLVHPGDRDRIAAEVRRLLAEGSPELVIELRIAGNDGAERWVELWIRQDPVASGFSGTMHDITLRRVAERRLETMALTDPLTGLANRRMLTRHLGAALDRGRHNDQHVAVLFLDLDRFKNVNDSMGHDAGDILLKAVGDRVSSFTRRGDLVGRLGGDEFVILCEGLSLDPGVAEVEVTAFACRLEHELSAPFKVLDREVFLTVSIGIAVARPGQRPDELLGDADAAMYRAKDRGRGRHEVFDDDLRASVERRSVLEPELHRAVANGELVPYYQPILDVASSSLVAAEALVRWQHPDRGLLGPAEFLDVAMETDVIRGIGESVLRQAIADIGRWSPPSSARRLSVAINLSAGEIVPSLPDVVAQLLADHRVDASSVCVEITEHHLLDATGPTVSILAALHDLGVRLAMDDFGTGYSSLAHLRLLPIDLVKIDRSFVSGIEQSADDRSIVSGIVRLSRELGLVTVAEGVETVGQLELLADMGCDRVQGYLLGRPQDAATFATTMLARRAHASVAV